MVRTIKFEDTLGNIDLNNCITKQYIVSFWYVLSLFFLYPSLLGAKYASIGLILVLGLACFLLLAGVKKVNKKLFFINLIFIFFYFIPGAFNPNSNIGSLLGGFAFLTSFTIATVLMLSRKKYLTSTCNVFLILLCMQSISCVITFLLVVTGVDINLLLILDFMPDERAPGNIFFPFSLGGTYFSTLDFRFIRFSGFFREPGVSQVAYLFSMAYTIVFLDRYKKITTLILFFGLLTTMSTTLLATLSAMLLFCFWYFVNNKFLKVISLFIIPFSLLIMYKAPYFGVEAKMETHTSTVTDRLAGFEYLIEELDQSYALGTGMYSQGQTDNASINFILSLRENGFFGLVCFALLYILPLLFFRRDQVLTFYILVSPMVITFLFAQPIFYSPLNLFIFSCSFMLVINLKSSRHV